MGKLPDRWLDYRPLGKRVEGARFIAFKTPLKETFATRLTVAERFTPEDLVKACPELGLVVDLTNTTKYYTKEEFLRRGVEYEKVNCPGQVIPPLDSVMRFFKVVDNFLFRHKNDDTLIGVHCTHGVNRTGYMICRYLIQKMGMPLSKAVVCVEKARGHKIERGNFIDHLKRFTSPIPVSTYSPEGEINKRPEMPIGGRKGAGRPHGGDSGRASPRPRGSDHFPDTRRLRTRSRTPPRAPAKKYQDAHHRDKIKFDLDVEGTTKDLAEMCIATDETSCQFYDDNTSIESVAPEDIQLMPPWVAMGGFGSQTKGCGNESNTGSNEKL